MVNGERNTMFVSIENKENERNITLKNIAGSIHNAQTNRLLKNVRVLSYVRGARVLTPRPCTAHKAGLQLPSPRGGASAAPLRLQQRVSLLPFRTPFATLLTTDRFKVCRVMSYILSNA